MHALFTEEDMAGEADSAASVDASRGRTPSKDVRVAGLVWAEPGRIGKTGVGLVRGRGSTREMSLSPTTGKDSGGIQGGARRWLLSGRAVTWSPIGLSRSP